MASSSSVASLKPYAPAVVAAMSAQRPTWQQTMLRIRDPARSLKFYCGEMGMTLVHSLHFNDMGFSLFFLASLRNKTAANASASAVKLDEHRLPPGLPGSDENHHWLWNLPHGQNVLELTWNHDSLDANGELAELPPATGDKAPLSSVDTAGRPQLYHHGNTDPVGFGHVAFNTPDVYAASERLEKAGCLFKKKPDEGRMKGLAFVLDPDGYWVELVRRDPDNDPFPDYEFNLSQTMIRVKDPKMSVPFYRDLFGMNLLSEAHFGEGRGDFSLFFMASTEQVDSKAKTMWNPCLELTHNHGTENVDGPAYHNGTDTQYKSKTVPRGFGHVGFIVDDLNAACDTLAAAGVTFVKKPSDGKMNSLAFVKDPDGYWIEVIQRLASKFPSSDPPASLKLPAEYTF